ncbi:MAG TPA: hypothetical protein VFI73_09120 [Candidatus Nitrosopolaris sp.]|nr:hypothetical protein [Candidatus Nitrosopolaris sp.]
MAIEKSLDNVLEMPQRKLVVANDDIDLSNHSNRNDIFILMVQESAGSAGGRGGGSGSRKIDKVMAFSCSEGICNKYFESIDQETIQQFEIPYSAVAMDIKLSTGRQLVVQGLVDPDFIKGYRQLINNMKNQ